MLLSGVISDGSRTAFYRPSNTFGVHDVEMASVMDDEQPSFATEHGRCIVTKNRDDLLELDRLQQQQRRMHSGILITAMSLPTDNFHMVARALANYDVHHPEPFVPGPVDNLHPPPDES